MATRLFSYIVLGLSLLGNTLAVIEITNLKSTYDAADGISLTWKDDDSYPPLDQITGLRILLCTGPNTKIQCGSPPLTTTVAATALAANLDLTNLLSMGGDGNYYLQLYADGGQYIQYSDRFKLTGMEGAVAATGSGAPPAAIYPPPPASLLSASFAIPYASQTGPTKYAPMQTQPGSTITRPLTPIPRYPTSAVTYFSTAMGPPYQVSTISASWTYTFSQFVNYASAMPTPTRYYAASAALASSVEAKSISRKKRWAD